VNYDRVRDPADTTDATHSRGATVYQTN